MKKQDSINDQLIEKMEQLAGMFRALLWEQAKEHGLSAMQVQLLVYIAQSPEEATISALARTFMLTKATISVAVKSLEYKGYVTRKDIKGDKRSYKIMLTEPGARIAHVSGFYLEPVKKVVAKIKLEEREILLKNISGIIQKMQPS